MLSFLRNTLRRAVVLALAGAAFASDAHAQLTTQDFRSAGDNLLVLDAATGLQWLTPVFTKNLTYEAPEVVALQQQYGFRYATGDEVRNMLVANFDPPLYPSGTMDGFDIAGRFFDYFGIADHIRCISGEVACPRTQGFTSTPGAAPNTRLAYGMIQFDIFGGMIADNPWPVSIHDTQIGHWLVRSTDVPPTTVPEPSTVLLCATGLVLLAVKRRRRTTPPRLHSGTRH